MQLALPPHKKTKCCHLTTFHVDTALSGATAAICDVIHTQGEVCRCLLLPPAGRLHLMSDSRSSANSQAGTIRTATKMPTPAHTSPGEQRPPKDLLLLTGTEAMASLPMGILTAITEVPRAITKNTGSFAATDMRTAETSRVTDIQGPHTTAATDTRPAQTMAAMTGGI